MAGEWMNDATRENLRLLLAARLSRKKGKYQGIGIETQDEYGREWAEREGHTVIDTAADVKSGRVAPWDRKNLRPWVTRPDLMARYDGILAFKNDRLSRGDWNDETRIRQWASENGKILVIVDGPQWPPRNEGDFWSWTAMAKQAEKEWDAIQERNLRMQNALRKDGKLVGATCFGYDIAGEMYDKTLAPNTLGRRYVPEMFQRIADGDSLSRVAAWLNGKQVKEKSWSPKTVSQIIHNRTYMGQRTDLKGNVVLHVEPLVDALLWKRANNRLAKSRTGRRNPATGEPALLSGALFCRECRAPMYRIRAWQGVFYRCAGYYPERKGCGSMVDLAALDKLVTEKLSVSGKPHKELRLVPGENHDVELAEIELALDDLPRRKLPDTEEDAERSRLRAQRDDLIEANKRAKPDRWEEEVTSQTEGDYFASLDAGERRAYLLKRYRILAGKNDDGEPYAVLDITGAYGLRTLDIAGRLPGR